MPPMVPLQSSGDGYRPTITGPNMFALLIREFARLKSPDCTQCHVPLPFWGPAPGNSAYWYMPSPRVCAYGCGQMLTELWARLTTEYRIAAPEQDQPQWKHGMRNTSPQS
jgi:hypothetical protein